MISIILFHNNNNNNLLLFHRFKTFFFIPKYFLVLNGPFGLHNLVHYSTTYI